jgi:glycine/D-amino acid oxidase-like deaminating enzyme
MSANGCCRVIICGGGIIGTAISYYLAKKGVCSTVVDRCGLAAAASGNAGGFLALDWNDATRLGPLARLSFELHAGLEKELGMQLDYRCAHCKAAA